MNLRRKFICLVFLTFTINAQEANWTATWKMDSSRVYITDSHSDNAGNIYTVGFNSSVSTDTSYDCIINKFSSVGTIEYSKKFYTGWSSQDPIITSDLERNIYVCSDQNIRKFSESGALLLEFSYSMLSATKIIVDSEGSIYVYGNLDDNDFNKTGSGIKKFNSEGIEMWDYVAFPISVPNGETAWLKDAIFDLDKNSIIVAKVKKSGSETIHIASIDKNGLVKWENEFSISGKTIMTPNKLLRISNGNYIVTGYCGLEYHENTYDAVTIAFLEDGSLSWYKTFDVNSDEDKALDMKSYNSGVVISGLGIYEDEKTMFAVYYDVNGTESWSYNDAPRIWLDSDPYYSNPALSTSIIIDNTDIYISGALDYGAGNSNFTTIRIDNSGNVIGNAMFTAEWAGRLQNSLRSNDKLNLICADHIYANAYDYIKIINYDFKSIVTEVKTKDYIAKDFYLEQNYPNPFNPSTQIQYQIAKAGNVTIKVYDVLGNEISTLVQEFKQPGKYSVIWNASQLPSGIYFYKLQSGSFSETKKMILIR